MLRYAITDREAGVRPGENAIEGLPDRCAQVARGGANILLLREKDILAGQLVTLSRGVIAAVKATGAATRVLVAGRVDVAVAGGADGVHLGSGAGELRVTQVRRVFAAAFVSVSCHNLDEVRIAREEGADAVLFAPVFGKWVGRVEVVKGVGVEALREACRAAGAMPVFALGGVTEANAAECMRAGAAGVAGIRMFFGVER